MFDKMPDKPAVTIITLMILAYECWMESIYIQYYVLFTELVLAI